jgi:methylmalonyl-CoA mutase cobalamin-binding subunit
LVIALEERAKGVAVSSLKAKHELRVAVANPWG